MSNWRSIPAEIVEDVIGSYCGQYPPTIAQLFALLESHHYKVKVGRFAVSTNHRKRVICLSEDSLTPFTNLLHETAEVLLRLPVAPEFYYVAKFADEMHEVAKLVEQNS